MVAPKMYVLQSFQSPLPTQKRGCSSSGTCWWHKINQFLFCYPHRAAPYKYTRNFLMGSVYTNNGSHDCFQCPLKWGGGQTSNCDYVYRSSISNLWVLWFSLVELHFLEAESMVNCVRFLYLFFRRMQITVQKAKSQEALHALYDCVYMNYNVRSNEEYCWECLPWPVRMPIDMTVTIKSIRLLIPVTKTSEKLAMFQVHVHFHEVEWPLPTRHSYAYDPRKLYLCYGIWMTEHCYIVVETDEVLLFTQLPQSTVGYKYVLLQHLSFVLL